MHNAQASPPAASAPAAPGKGRKPVAIRRAFGTQVINDSLRSDLDAFLRAEIKLKAALLAVKLPDATVTPDDVDAAREELAAIRRGLVSAVIHRPGARLQYGPRLFYINRLGELHCVVRMPANP